MGRSRRYYWSAASGAVALFASALLSAQDGGRARNDDTGDDVARRTPARELGNPTRCISTTRLDRTEVVDDETVLFFMRGGDVYLNRLSRSCPGLEREKRFTYRVYSNQLCRIDTITVLESRAFGLTDGFSCALGNFYPISADEAARLTGEFWPPDVEVEAVELPKEQDAESGDEAADAPEEAADGARSDTEESRSEAAGDRP